MLVRLAELQPAWAVLGEAAGVSVRRQGGRIALEKAIGEAVPKPSAAKPRLRRTFS